MQTKIILDYSQIVAKELTHSYLETKCARTFKRPPAEEDFRCILNPPPKPPRACTSKHTQLHTRTHTHTHTHTANGGRWRFRDPVPTDRHVGDEPFVFVWTEKKNHEQTMCCEWVVVSMRRVYVAMIIFLPRPPPPPPLLSQLL